MGRTKAAPTSSIDEIREQLERDKRMRKMISAVARPPMVPNDLVYLLMRAAKANTKKSSWAEGSGNTPEGLTRFPRQLQRLAKEIERVNRHHFIDPRLWIVMKERDAPLRRSKYEDFRRLPEILQNYSLFLTDEVFPAIAHTKHYTEQDKGLSNLLANVYRATGKYFYNELVELLNAVAGKAGSSREFFAGALKQRKYRMSRSLCPYLASDAHGEQFLIQIKYEDRS